MYQEFRDIGRDLFLAGLVSSHGGNMSVRLGDRILITRRGSMIGRLKEHDLIETGLEKDDSHIALASTEIGVHRAIYKKTSALAIIHAHPPVTVALSLTRDEIIPLDSEGSYLLHRVPILSSEYTVGAEEVAAIVSEALQKYKIVVLRGHGTFAIGQFLEEAYQWTSSLEISSQIIYFTEALQKEVKEYRKATDRYHTW
ncbi:aldolase [Moorellaceae bacterium AZ2]